MRRWLGVLAVLAPCAAARAGVIDFPGQGVFGTLLFEDLWPCLGDLDFNDAVIRYNVSRTTQGTDTTAVSLTIEVDALGATRCGGLGWRLPVPRSAVASVTRRVGDPNAADGTPWGDAAPLSLIGDTDVSESGGDVVIWLADDLRALACGGAAGFLNTDGPALAECAPITFDVRLAAPTALAADEPWDLFLFSCDDRAHQTHRSVYPGLAAGDPWAADPSEPGTCDDGSGPGRWYVSASGIPFVLNLGEGNGTEGTGPAPYPAEKQRIDLAMPRILELADGPDDGDPGWDFHVTGTNPTYLYTGPRPTLVAFDPDSRDDDGDGACVGFDHDGSPATPDTCLFGVAPGDCDDADDTRAPILADPWGDGLDSDCDGLDGVDADGDSNASVASGGSDCDDADPAVTLGTPTCPAASCKDLLARFPATFQQDGEYTIQPYASAPFQAWCDQTTDGGGWTMLLNPTSMAISEFPGLTKTTSNVVGLFNCPSVWTASSAFGTSSLENYSCGTATVTWTLGLPDAFGSHDVIFVANVQGENTHTLTIDGTSLAPDATSYTSHLCWYYNGNGTSASPNQNRCHNQYVSAPPRVEHSILTGNALSLSIRSGEACKPDCNHGTGSYVRLLGVR